MWPFKRKRLLDRWKVPQCERPKDSGYCCRFSHHVMSGADLMTYGKSLEKRVFGDKEKEMSQVSETLEFYTESAKLSMGDCLRLNDGGYVEASTKRDAQFMFKEYKILDKRIVAVCFDMEDKEMSDWSTYKDLYKDIAASDANEILKLQRENPDKEYVAISICCGDRLAYEVKEPKVVKIPERELDKMIESIELYNDYKILSPDVFWGSVKNLIEKLKAYKE